MKRYTYILLTLVSLIVGNFAASARYASRMTPDGTIFFIEPHKLGRLSNIRRFEYDMTLLSWTDSVTINFTFEAGRMTMPESMMIKSGEKEYRCTDYSILYVDIKGNHYEVRVTSKFSVTDIQQVLESSFPPVFEFFQDGIYEQATYKDGAWKKDQKKLLNIFRLYLYSKQ